MQLKFNLDVIQMQLRCLMQVILTIQQTKGKSFTFAVGWVVWISQIKAISAFNQIEVEVEAELGNKNACKKCKKCNKGKNEIKYKK